MTSSGIQSAPQSPEAAAAAVAAKNDLVAAAIAVAAADDAAAKTALRLAEARVLRALGVGAAWMHMYSETRVDEARTRRARAAALRTRLEQENATLARENARMRATLAATIARHNEELAGVSAQIARIADIGRSALVNPPVSLFPHPPSSTEGAARERSGMK